MTERERDRTRRHIAGLIIDEAKAGMDRALKDNAPDMVSVAMKAADKILEYMEWSSNAERKERVRERLAEPLMFEEDD